VPIDPESPAMIQFSSGSTGRPKRIARTHAMVMRELDALVSTLELGSTDRFLAVAPFSHVNGLTRSMLASLRAGAALYPKGKYDRYAVAELIERERLTVFIAVPLMFSALAETGFSKPPDFSSLRLTISASAPMPRKFNALFREKFGMYVRQLYGSTETGTISVNTRAEIEQTLESVGTPLTGVVVTVFDEHHRPVTPGEVGEIAVSSPFAISAYVSEEAAHQAAFRDGFYLTGDLGRLDGDGSLYLVGRKTFFINKGGLKIDPREVEDVLESHAQVEEVVVVGVPSSYGDERVKAVIVRRGECTEADIVRHCRGRIADFKVPSLVEFRESLPKSPTGKIRRALLV
jgi:long-chain acyl-CoA synthetase